MLLTDRFVFIHVPSTGGTYVTAAMQRAFRDRVAAGEADAPIDLVDGDMKHAGCASIPASHRHLPIVANVRNTYDHYVAYYEYAWWKKEDVRGITQAEMRRRYPHFPDLDFAEFVEMSSVEFREVDTPHLADDDQPGFHTEQFVRMFFRDPERVLAGFGREYVESGRYRDDMYDVRFLRNDDLTADVATLLGDEGFDRATIDALAEMGRIYPNRVIISPLDYLRRRRPRRTERNWRRYYTPEIAAVVRRREWFLFHLFPDFDLAFA